MCMPVSIHRLVKTDKMRSPPCLQKRKRIYRRHPKADTHGPKHPASAYVLFANDVRKKLGDTQLSFTQISQRIGKSWQLFGSGEPSKWKMQAAKTKDAYLQDLGEYKKTDEYREYQRYLVDFKRKRKSSSITRSRRPLPRRSSNPRVDVCGDYNHKVSRRLENWLESSPSACTFPQSKMYIGPYIASGQILKDEVIGSTQPGNLRVFDCTGNELNMPTRPLFPANGLESGTLMLSPRLLSQDVSPQASHRPRLHRAETPRVSLRETEQKQQDSSIGNGARCEIRTMSHVQQSRCALCPSYSHSGVPTSDSAAPSTKADRDESATGDRSGQGSGQELEREPRRRRRGYFETVLQSSESCSALGRSL